MGRPLFSTSYSTPVVRTEPEPAPPTIPFEKWTHWNAFDPDSDEFFESPDAVYEAFLDPADVPPATGESVADGAGGRAPEPEILEAIIARELAEGRSDSPASTEGTISGRGSPMAVGSDDPADMVIDAYRTEEFEPRRYFQRATETDIAARMTRHSGNDVEYHRTGEATMPPLRYADDDVLVTTAIDLMNERRVSRVMPPLSPFRSRGFIPQFSLSSNRAITPPHSNDHNEDESYGYATYEQQASPSPPPTVTPRLYSWSSRGPLGRGDPGSPSPHQRQRPRPGPLTNPSARMSLTHISPAPVRIRMA
jgi:hypothetical protein